MKKTLSLLVCAALVLSLAAGCAGTQEPPTEDTSTQPAPTQPEPTQPEPTEPDPKRLYNRAMGFYNQEEYYKARENFLQIPDYADSLEKAQECLDRGLEQDFTRHLKAGEFEEAHDILQNTGLKDSPYFTDDFEYHLRVYEHTVDPKYQELYDEAILAINECDFFALTRVKSGLKDILNYDYKKTKDLYYTTVPEAYASCAQRLVGAGEIGKLLSYLDMVAFTRGPAEGLELLEEYRGRLGEMARKALDAGHVSDAMQCATYAIKWFAPGVEDLTPYIRENAADLALRAESAGDLTDVRICLDLMEEQDGAGADRLREEIRARQHMEPDYSFWAVLEDIDPTHVEADENTTTLEMALAVAAAFHHRVPYVQIVPLQGEHWSGEKRDAVIAHIPNILGTNYDNIISAVYPEGRAAMGGLDFSYGPETFTITFEGTIKDGDGNVVDRISGEELIEYEELFEQFCEDSLRLLNDRLLIGAGMSAKQKAGVILRWVSYFLDYDEPQIIHDPGIAIMNRKGVCISYTCLYDRMCNLAGVTTYGQECRSTFGINSLVPSDSLHITSVQLDEEGNTFYTDSTWADGYEACDPWLGWKDLDELVDGFAATFGNVDFEGGIAPGWFWQSEPLQDHDNFIEYPFPFLEELGR